MLNICPKGGHGNLSAWSPLPRLFQSWTQLPLFFAGDLLFLAGGLQFLANDLPFLCQNFSSFFCEKTFFSKISTFVPLKWPFLIIQKCLLVYSSLFFYFKQFFKHISLRRITRDYIYQEMEKNILKYCSWNFLEETLGKFRNINTFTVNQLITTQCSSYIQYLSKICIPFSYCQQFLIFCWAHFFVKLFDLVCSCSDVAIFIRTIACSTFLLKDTNKWKERKYFNFVNKASNTNFIAKGLR